MIHNTLSVILPCHNEEATIAVMPPPATLAQDTPHAAPRRKLFVLLAIIAVAFCNGFAIWYVLSEALVYHYDSIGYWVQLVEFKNDLIANPGSALYWFWRGLRADDYPRFTIAPLLPFIFFGTTRLWYILAIVNMFVLPAVGAFVLVSHAFMGLARLRSTAYPPAVPKRVVIALMVILLSPIFWMSTLAGLPSVGGLAIIFIVVYLMIQRMPHLRWRDEAIIGVLLFLLGRFRRWYLIWISAYFAARLVIVLFVALRERQWRSFLRSAAQLLLCLGVFSGLLFSISGPFALRALTSDYSVLYQAFQIKYFSWFNALTYAHGQMGYLFVLTGIMGFLFAMMHQRLRLISVFLIMHYGISFFLQTKNQGFAYQHLYLLLPTLLIFSTFFFFRITALARHHAMVIVPSALFLLTLLLGVYYPPAVKALNHTAPWSPSEVLPPRVRSDLAVLRHLHWDLFDLSRSPDNQIYILASSIVFNDEILRHQHFSFPQQPDLSGKILPMRDLDLRDGFPTDLFRAKYVVIAEPFQVYSLEEYSRILTFPAQRILNNQGMGKAYRQLPNRYQLEKDIAVTIFERTRKFTPDEVNELTEALRAAYPDSPSVSQGFIPPDALSSPL